MRCIVNCVPSAHNLGEELRYVREGVCDHLGKKILNSTDSAKKVKFDLKWRGEGGEKVRHANLSSL